MTPTPTLPREGDKVAESALFGAILPFLWIYLWQNAVFLVRFCHFYGFIFGRMWKIPYICKHGTNIYHHGRVDRQETGNKRPHALLPFAPF
jgi:hypothetical protein